MNERDVLAEAVADLQSDTIANADRLSRVEQAVADLRDQVSAARREKRRRSRQRSLELSSVVTQLQIVHLDLSMLAEAFSDFVNHHERQK